VWRMPPKIDRYWEGYITGLSDAKYSYFAIIKACKQRGFVVSKKGISSVLNSCGKRRSGAIPVGKKQADPRPSTSRTPDVIRKVRSLVTGPNPATQRAIATKVGTSVYTVNTIINRDLKLEKRHKSHVHKLLPRHVNERRTNSRKLYERYLAGEKWKYVVTLDEAYVYLSDCNKPRAIFYRPRGTKEFRKWYKESRESFSKGFMLVAGYSYNGKLTLHKVDPKTKVNAAYYQANVLKPIIERDIPALYGGEANQVWIHQDKASSHTAASTRLYMEQMQDETGIHSIPFDDIPVKSPDASPMDFCAFGLLKRALGSRRPRTLSGLWKICQEEWLRIDIGVLRASLLQWKLRCRAIAAMRGYQIEHNRWWRKGFSAAPDHL